MMATILLVCTGNLCRSPMAAALLRAQLDADPERSGWSVLSAGTWAPRERGASAYAVVEMSKRGLDLGDHRSRNVDERLMEKADLVLVMTRNHVEALSAAFPELAHKVHLLSHMIGETYDISDPYGGSPAEYSRTARELEGLIREGYERIVSLAETACEG